VLQIRKFTIQDYESVISLWREAELPHRTKGRDSFENIKKELNHENAIFLVAEWNDTIVGSIFGTHDGRKGWINRLAVAPKFQKRGIAQKLLTEVEHWIFENGIGIVAALIENWNTNSLKYFKKAHYQKEKEILYFTKRKSSEW
jgi:ribosomal protein S18 acetylase RimI-like enzyme